MNPELVIEVLLWSPGGYLGEDLPDRLPESDRTAGGPVAPDQALPGLLRLLVQIGELRLLRGGQLLLLLLLLECLALLLSGREVGAETPELELGDHRWLLLLEHREERHGGGVDHLSQ